MKDILYFRSSSGKYIYLCLLGSLCPDAKTFYTIFPQAIALTEKEFQDLHDNSRAEVVTVGDAKDVDELLADSASDLIVVNSKKE